MHGPAVCFAGHLPEFLREGRLRGPGGGAAYCAIRITRGCSGGGGRRGETPRLTRPLGGKGFR